jgi:translation initiation factor 1 (eIF-1/SUI1)
MKYVSKRLASCLVGSFALLVSVGAVEAITVTNRDDKDHKVTIIEGEAKKDHTLKAAAVLENLCMKGCVVRLNDSENDEYELEGTEVVSIEDGYLYYDGPETPTEQPPAGAPKPQ